MKNALLFFGPPRTFRKNIVNIQELILKDNQFDIFLSTGIDKNEELVTIIEYIDALQPLDFIITHTKKIHLDLLNSMNLKCSGNTNVNQYKQNMYNGWYKKYLGLNLIKTYQKENRIKYKNILVYRPDIRPLSKIDINFEYKENTIYSNHINKDHGGWVADLMAFGSFDSMDKYLSYYEAFDDKFKNKDNFHPETSLYEYLITKELNLDYYKHDCLIVREDQEYRIF
jgi:hypothetical protein